MNRKTKTILLTLLAFCLGSLIVLSSCTTNDEATVDEAALNREYMSQVSLLLDDLATELQGFSDAVSRSDIVGMNAQSERANRIIADFESIEAPEELKEIHTEYLEGCNTLKSALSEYIGLFTEVDSSTEANPFDFDTYDERIKKINETYQEGIDLLESADKKATELE